MSSRVRNTDEKISQIQDRLAEIEEERRRLTAELTRLNRQGEPHSPPQVVREPDSSSVVHKLSSSDEKIRLFRSLFRGREDVYPRRWESAKTGRSGYSPACRNEWVPGICEKPKVKCGDCSVRDLLPVTDAAIRDHLVGHGQNVSAISQSVCTRCCRTKHVGSLRSISTRRLGGMKLRRISKPAEIGTFRQHLKGPGLGTVATFGSSSPVPFRRRKQEGLVPG